MCIISDVGTKFIPSFQASGSEIIQLIYMHYIPDFRHPYQPRHSSRQPCEVPVQSLNQIIGSYLMISISGQFSAGLLCRISGYSSYGYLRFTSSTINIGLENFGRMIANILADDILHTCRLGQGKHYMDVQPCGRKLIWKNP